MSRLSVTINGERIEADVEPRTSLADFLRGARGLTGTHLGCEHGVCGACTIMIDGMPMRSCIAYAVQIDGCDVRTIEGFDADDVMERLRTEFSRRHALQCGFCTPGMLITARDIVTRLGDPGEERVREELAGNLCRCTGYAGIVQAIREVGAARRDRATAAPELIRPAAPGAVVSMPVESPPAAEPAASPPLTPSNATEIAHSFVVGAKADQVWAFFRDLPAVAACIPGAELQGYDARNFTGRIAARIGPIRASIAGAGTYQFDDQSRSGTLTGAGKDALSGSRVAGALTFRLAKASEQSTRVDATLSFTLQGLLGQFSRSSIAREFTARVLDEFAARVSAVLAGGPANAPRSAKGGLGILSLVRWWLRSLFERSPPR